MDSVVFIAFSFVIGACLGSFFCCQARRLHIMTSPSSHRPATSSAHISSAKPKPHASTKVKSQSARLPARSVCLSCHYQLRWYDNIPIISWLLLRGKCRRCHQPIGIAELLAELGTAFAAAILAMVFLGSRPGTMPFITAPDPFALFGSPSASPAFYWAVFLVLFVFAMSLCFLAIYDGLHGTLPVFALTISTICAIIVLILRIWSFFSVSSFSFELLTQPLFGALLLGGTYLVLYLVSHGRWVGDGDWILGAAIGLTFGSPWLALIALFLTNLLACLIMIPVTWRRHTRVIYLGPFLVAGFICTIVASCAIIGV